MPTEDAAASCQVQNNSLASILSFSFTVPAGTNQALVVCIEFADNLDVSAVTYNNLPLAILTNFHPGHLQAPRVVIAYLLVPPQGTFTLKVTASGNARFTVQARSYSNVDQVNTWGTVQTASSASNTTGVSVTLASIATDVCLDAVIMGGSTSGLTVNAGEASECNTGVAVSAGGSGNRSAVNAVMGWHHSSSSARSWAYAAAPLHDYVPPININPAALTLAEQVVAPAVAGGAKINPLALAETEQLPAPAVTVAAFTFDRCQEGWAQQGPPPGSNEQELAAIVPSPSGYASPKQAQTPSGWQRAPTDTASWDMA